MKHIVLSGGLDAQAIRPPKSFVELVDRSVLDAASYFGDSTDVVPVSCPGCASDRSDAAFEKQQFTYRRCHECGSVFVSPRPSRDALARYYRDSDASALRIQFFTKTSGDARWQQVIRSRVDWLQNIVSRDGAMGGAVCDVGTLYPRLFDELRELDLFSQYVSLDAPSDLHDALSAMGVEVDVEPVGYASVITAFEQLEHHQDPHAFLARMHTLLQPNGMLFLTTRTVSGFDLQVLGGAAPYIFVPEHLNLLSLEGLTRALEIRGFELIEVSTPGQLDVEFVQNALRSDPSIDVPRFVRYLLEQRDPETHADFQAFLQRNRLSSHVRLAAKKMT